MMKRVFASALIAIAVTSGACAQDAQPRREGFHKGRGSFGVMQQLSLTDNQKKEMKSINENFKNQLTELKKNEDITVREWKSRMKTIQDDHRSKIQSVLTDEQKAKIEKIKQERKDKAGKKGFHHRGRKGHGQGFDKMKTELGLTPAQVDALKKNRAEASAKFKALREDKSLSQDQKKVEIKKFREQQHESFKSILTEEQLKKLQQRKPHRQQPVQ